MAAFSQRMPPVQKLITVLSCRSALCACSASGNSVNLVMPQLMVFLNVPASTSNWLRVSSVTTGRPSSSWPWSNHRLAVSGVTAGCSAFGRANAGVVHADDFVFHLHQHLAKRLGVRPTFLGGEVGKPGVGAQPVNKATHILCAASQEEINAFFCYQNRAFELARQGLVQARLTQGLGRRAGRQICSKKYSEFGSPSQILSNGRVPTISIHVCSPAPSLRIFCR